MVNQGNIDNITASILKSYEEIGGINHLEGTNLPSRESIELILRKLQEMLFPGYFEKINLTKRNLCEITSKKVENIYNLLSQEICKSLQLTCDRDYNCKDAVICMKNTKEIIDSFLDFIPKLRKKLKKDIHAIYEGDPAAKNEDEIILSYPGFQAITVYRLAHFLYQKQVPLIPRIMTEIVHSETGIDIHPGATVGESLCIDHGTGIVIGETAVIGNNVKLYQGITLGALSVPKRDKVNIKRHPTLEDNVTVYARTTILGGDTVIGKNSVIGGNVWLISSVPPNSKVYIDSESRQVVKNNLDK